MKRKRKEKKLDEKRFEGVDLMSSGKK